MMGSTGGPQATSKASDNKLTIDNLWKILATEKNINEAVGKMQQSFQKEQQIRSKSRNGIYDPQEPSKTEKTIGSALR